ATYRYLADKDFLLKTKDGTPATRHWWNGHSAILDLSNDAAAAWYKGQLDHLVTEYHIDGFKLDGGDPMYYELDDISAASLHPNEHAEQFARFGIQYSLNEFRAGWKMAGEPVVQRLCDKLHSWAASGLGSL